MATGLSLTAALKTTARPSRPAMEKARNNPTALNLHAPMTIARRGRRAPNGKARNLPMGLNHRAPKAAALKAQDHHGRMDHRDKMTAIKNRTRLKIRRAETNNHKNPRTTIVIRGFFV